MSHKPFTVYPGQFICKTCDEVVKTMRYWKDTVSVSWMCSNKHISSVDILPPSRKDHERKERE
jgi:hypothetical protein